MKKIMKKALAFAMAFAMVAGFFAAVGAEEAKAAEDPGQVYIVGTVTEDGWDAFTAMTSEGDGVYSYTRDNITAGGYEYKFTGQDGWGALEYGNNDSGGNFTVTAGQNGSIKITIDMKLVNGKNAADAVTVTGTSVEVELVAEEVFQVVGAESMLGVAWDAAFGQDVNILEKQTDGTFKLTLEAVPAGTHEFKVQQDAEHFGWSKTIWNDAYASGSNMAVTLTEISDVTFVVAGNATDGYTLTVTTVKTVLPSDEIEAMIDALPSVDDVAISDKADVQAVKNAIDGLDDAVKAQVDATKIAKVDALLAKIAELEAAAADTANVIVHFKNTNDWTAVNMYAFVEAGTMFGAWPGLAMTEDAENEGWYSAKFEYAEDFTVIFNGGGQQTINIPVDVAEEGKTEVWIEMGPLAEEPDEFGNTNYTFTLATEAPAGYIDGDETVVEVTLPEADDETGDDETGDDETGDDETGDDETGDDETADDEEDAATAWDDATLKVHVQMPDVEGWDKLGAYLFGTGEAFGWSGGSGELTGAWPGVELLPEVNSENGWYAFGGTFADGYYMLIINNFVSDAEAAEGATKLQAADLEITDGEYWITLALDEETGKYVATTATEAPEDYDGEGLESVVEDPAGDDETGDDETGDDETGDDETGDDETGDDVTDGEDGGVDKDDQPATGDNAPIAVVTMIALVAGASAVVIRKRRVA